MSLALFIESLTGKIFKILPLSEEESNGAQNHVYEYLDSLKIEMFGAIVTFPALFKNVEYTSVLNIVQYLSVNEVSIKRCKREVFKALRLLNKISKELGGESVE